MNVLKHETGVDMRCLDGFSVEFDDSANNPVEVSVSERTNLISIECVQVDINRTVPACFDRERAKVLRDLLTSYIDSGKLR
jgi:hypothetical protein